MVTVLVIEDEPAIRNNVLQTLELLNFQALGAENGMRGVVLARQHLPDLIICDVMMPELNGYGVLLEIRNNPITATIPFIFLTAQADRTAMRQGMAMGADDYLTKPFTLDELTDAIKARLERHNVLEQEHEQTIGALRSNILRALPHEFRTPLSAILGYSSMILSDPASLEMDEIVDLTERINHSGERLLHLVENYLTYVQIETVRVDNAKIAQLRTSYASYPQAVIQDSAKIAAQMKNRQSDLKLEIGPGEAIQISDENLSRIVKELTDNAFKFSQPGTLVFVSATQRDDKYVLQVSDRGVGMTPQQIANVEAFMQFERTVREQQGIGLGLVIVRGLVELYAGTLNIESVVGAHTTVRVTLDVHQ
jgi:signal transduction histidine kinase